MPFMFEYFIYQESRRAFLARVVKGTVAGAAIHGIMSHTGIEIPGKVAWERVETGTLFEDSAKKHRELEEKYKIWIINPGPEANNFMAMYKNDKDFYAPPVRWDASTLSGIDDSLSILPEHFYQPHPKQNGKRVTLLLAQDPLLEVPKRQVHFINEEKSFCTCRAGVEPRIVFKKSMIGQTFGEKKQSRSTIVHEFTHHLTSPEINRYAESIGHQVGLFDERDLHDVFKSEISFKRVTPLNPEDRYFHVPAEFDLSLKDIVRKRNPYLVFLNEYYAVDRDLFEQYTASYVDSANKYERSIQSERINKGYHSSQGASADLEHGLNFKVKLFRPHVNDTEVDYHSELGYGAQNWQEFFAVAAENYIQGGKSFVKTYKKFLGDEGSVLLYQRIKDELFRGREY